MPLYDFECPECSAAFEMMMTYEEFLDCDRQQSCRKCGKWALNVPRMPAVHTLSTHFKGTGISYGGDYIDQNLCDPKTREPIRITSLNHKKRVMKEIGVFEKGPHENRVKALKRRHSVSFTKSSGQAA